MELIKITNLKTYYLQRAPSKPKGVIKAVDGVDLSIVTKEALGLVGESGSGKTTLAYSIVRLLPRNARIVDGSILFHPLGVDMLKSNESEMRKIRGKEVGIIFQDPMTFLNPAMTVAGQIAEGIIRHQKCSREEAKKRAIELLEKIKMPEPFTVASYYPHQLSGGMRQRVIIAIAISCNPQLLIADEPTTALDVTVQAQILKLIKELQAKLGMSLLLITHDLAVAANVCDKVVVMYAGKIAEEGDVHSIYKNPIHPYTAGLLKVTPRLKETNEGIQTMEGEPPDPTNTPTGCRFHPRCPYAKEKCSIVEPPLKNLDDGRRVACWMVA